MSLNLTQKFYIPVWMMLLASLDEDQDDSPAQEFSTLLKQDLAQATQAWADAKDEAERRLDISLAVRFAELILTLKVSVLLPEFGKRVRAKVLLRKTASQVMFLSGKRRTLKGSSMTSSRSCSRGRIRMTFSMNWRLTVIRTFLRAICCRFLALLLRVKSRRVIAWPGTRKLWISG